MTETAPPLLLENALDFADLYDDEGLVKLDRAFLRFLEGADPALAGSLAAARAAPDSLAAAAESELLLALAPHLDAFVARLFGIEPELKAAADRHHRLAPLYTCRRLFVQRRAAKAFAAEEAASFDGEALAGALAQRFGQEAFDPLRFAVTVLAWMEDEPAHAADLDLASRYAAWAVLSPAGRRLYPDDVLFRVPGKVEHQSLVPQATIDLAGAPAAVTTGDHTLARDGFALTDRGTDLAGALSESSYCILCHHQGRDSCSKGLKDKKTGAFTKNPLGVTIPGCPLEEKISEMHEAKNEGLVIAALAIACIDNPMLAATGHRICNDCMKACIYQKQDPVNIPQVETRVLKDVLALPWGFEIYSLLTRWNPLNVRRPLPLSASGYKVLVVGLGPAGFSLAHHLMNAGHAVTAVDGAKIEPLPAELSGVDQLGGRVPFRPIRDIGELYEDLDDRVMAGFGGVAEYGITVRWDKNFLKVIRLLLERRQRLTMLGGTRFGSAITAESAFAMGFDHIALAAGAGKPTLLGIPNELARGVRQASDFLMALQLTGAAKLGSVANLQIRLPIVVVGGGLTAIDTATEALTYYVRQVEKFRQRYEILVEAEGTEAVRATWTAEDKAIADEFLTHAQALGEEREAARREGRPPAFIPLLDAWGGSTIAYRRRMIDAPSYTLNHEEIIKALEQGVRFAELLAPKEILLDDFGHVRAFRLARQRIGEGGRPEPSGDEVELPARTILVAAGTQPNTVLAREHPGFAALDGKYFAAVDETGAPAKPERSTKPATPHVLMQFRADGRAMSFFGDLHPSYAGNVVKALASAKQGYPVVDRALRRRAPEAVTAETLAAQLNDALRPTVVAVKPLTTTAHEITVRAPFAAQAYGPGQFFRVQNFEANAPRANGTTLAMEAVALTGAMIDRKEGLISLIALDMGGSTSLLPLLKAGERIVLMGPTGAVTETEHNETVLLAGGGVGNAELLSMKTAFHAAGCRILFFAAYRKPEDRFHPHLIEADSDVVVWCCDEAPGLDARRPQDKAFVGNVVQAMQAYAEGRLGDGIPLSDVDRIFVVGSDAMMAAVARARHGVLKPYLKADHIGVGSINSPMQCMMKEICAQCLQPHVDPVTGERSVVFSCFCQDQFLDHVDFGALRARLMQNAVQEKLTRRWIAHCKRALTHA
ncbi:MAG: FAD-dependent oxidoreductase [Defluviicoccus sp.]|nr:FAD-dependent oxidoreductase [Defluviicoccus sp.]MDG4592618.1 FAD-dependent oxidoreductase [Defluviicoccus sp.]